MWPEAVGEKELEVREKGRVDRPCHGLWLMPRSESRGLLFPPLAVKAALLGLSLHTCKMGLLTYMVTSSLKSKSNLTLNNPICSAISSQHPWVSILRCYSLNFTSKKAWDMKRANLLTTQCQANNYLLSTYYVPRAGVTVVNKIANIPDFREQIGSNK